MEEMYVINLFAKTRTFTNDKGKPVKFQEPYCEITDSDGLSVYSGQVTNSNAQFHGNGATNPFLGNNNVQNLADLASFLLQNVSTSPLFCLRSHVRDVDLDRLTPYASKDLGAVANELNIKGDTRWYRLELHKEPSIKDVDSKYGVLSIVSNWVRNRVQR